MRSPKSRARLLARSWRIMLPKHPTPTIPLTKSELADLAAYILSLRERE
jgi:hypothetical protein